MLHLLPIKPFLIVFVLALVKGTTSAGAEDAAVYTFDNVSNIIEKAREDAKKITLPVNTYSDKGLQAAKQTSDTFFSKQFQEKIQCEQQRIEKEVFSGYIAPWKQKQQIEEGQRKSGGSLSSTEKVYLFFSSSVPDETVQTYIAVIAEAGEPNLVLAMRGWPSRRDGAATKVDTQYFSKILQKELTCQRTQTPCEYYQLGINLQPSLFVKYGITQVPAVVYVNDKAAYRTQGDSGLDYLLERINREAKRNSLNKLISTIRNI